MTVKKKNYTPKWTEEKFVLVITWDVNINSINLTLLQF